MLTTLSIARQTFAQCVRMKVAVAFIVLMGLSLLALPVVMTGDDTLAGQIRAFLAYSTGMVGTLLSLMTVFVGASLVSNDIRDKQIFMLVVKPVAKFEYVIGRWLGLAVLNVMLIAVAAVAINITVHYMSSRQETKIGRVSVADRLAVETEVMTARKKIGPDIDHAAVQAAVTKRIRALSVEGQLESALDSLMAKAGDNREQAKMMLQAKLFQDEMAGLQSVAGGKSRKWTFSNVHAAESEMKGAAKVISVQKPAQDGTAKGLGPIVVVLQVDKLLAGSLFPRRPVVVNGADARVGRRQKDILFQVMFPGNTTDARVLSLSAGKEVEFGVIPVIQFSFTPQATGGESIKELNAKWVISNNKGDRFVFPNPRAGYKVRRKATLTFTSRAIGTDGQITVELFNESKSGVNLKSEDTYILYSVGGFDANFIRGMLLLACQVTFVAAVAVFAGSFVSFPVACLLCMSLLPFSLAREFVSDAVSSPDSVVTFVGYVVNGLMRVLLPDFANTMPGARFVNGDVISWVSVGDTALLDIGIRGAAALLLACVIFYRRELARVQV